MNEMTRVPQAAVFAPGATASNTIQLDYFELIGLIIPSGTWTAAALFFTASSDGVSFFPIQDDSAVLASIAAADVVVGKAITPIGILSKLQPYRYFQLNSGAPGALVAQVSGITINVVAKG